HAGRELQPNGDAVQLDGRAHRRSAVQSVRQEPTVERGAGSAESEGRAVHVQCEVNIVCVKRLNRRSVSGLSKTATQSVGKSIRRGASNESNAVDQRIQPLAQKAPAKANVYRKEYQRHARAHAQWPTHR